MLESNRLVLDEIKTSVEGSLEDDSSIQGRVCLCKGILVRKGAVIRGRVIVGENATIQSNAYIGPYTSIGRGCTIKRGEIANSIIMDGCIIDIDDRIVDSLIGPNSVILNGSNGTPKGRKFVLGES